MNVRNSPFFFLHLVTVCFLSITWRLQQETIPQKHVVFGPVHSDNVTAAEQLRRILSFQWNCWCLFHHRLLWEPFSAAHLKCQINSCCLFWSDRISIVYSVPDLFHLETAQRGCQSAVGHPEPDLGRMWWWEVEVGLRISVRDEDVRGA